MTTAAAAAVTAGMLLAAPAAEAATPGQTLSQDLALLRSCESGGDYAIDTGNGYYGAYQFDLRTWEGLGLSGLPSQAAPAVQDRAAATLEQQRGWEPWPACSARFGLVPIYGVPLTPAAVAAPVAAPAAAPVAVREAPSVARPVAPVRPERPRPWHGQVLTTALAGGWNAQVERWQERMVQRGWFLAVDGRFGPQTAAVAAEFARNFRLRGVLPGEVNKTVWDSAWTLAVVN